MDTGHVIEEQPAAVEGVPLEYAVVEIMGHRRLAGRILKVERFGVKMLRIDVPTKGDFANGFVSQFYSEAGLVLNRDQYARPGPRLAWVIAGGESGRQARPMNVAWVRSLIRQCADAGTAVFVKQLGARPCLDSLDHPLRLHDRKGGDMAEWPAELRVREMPEDANG